MSHFTYKDTSEIHWNELLPGDTFTVRGEDMEGVQWELKSGIAITDGDIVMVVSRRIGTDHPLRARDHYVFLLPGPRLTPEVLL